MGCCATHPPPETNLTLSPPEPAPHDSEMEKNVIKIQAHYRGHKVRKNKTKNEEESERKNDDAEAEEIKNLHAPSAEFAKKIYELPTITNLNVLEAMKKADGIERREESGLPVLGPYELENGAVYLGQWKYG